MDEEEYRSTYNRLNPNRCIFEKSITNRRCDCQLKKTFRIATREGTACKSERAMKRCTNVLDAMRQNARFSLKVTIINGPMPHNKELQVQAGGMLALQTLTANNQELTEVQKTVVNIHQTMKKSLNEYGTIEQFPFGEIVKGIVKYQSRPKRNKKK